jgi:hypothetical protein
VQYSSVRVARAELLPARASFSGALPSIYARSVLDYLLYASTCILPQQHLPFGAARIWRFSTFPAVPAARDASLGYLAFVLHACCVRRNGGLFSGLSIEARRTADKRFSRGRKARAHRRAAAWRTSGGTVLRELDVLGAVSSGRFCCFLLHCPARLFAFLSYTCCVTRSAWTLTSPSSRR